MAEREQETESESSAPSQPEATSPRPSPRPVPAGPTLDSKGEALTAILTQRLAPLAPPATALLDEVAVTVEPSRLLEVCSVLREDQDLAFDFLRCLSVVDYQDSFQVVYHLWSMEHRHKMVLKTDTAYDDPRVPSVVPVWRGADWFEREGHDLFGVVFEGHPDPKPLLLWEGFEGYPGRRSFPFHEYDEF